MKTATPWKGSSSPSAKLARHDGGLRGWMVLTIALLAIWLIWRINHAKMDILYDYSLVASGVGFLHEGMTPYRDFVTPLQSLNFYIAYFCENLFGKVFFSLTYGNLILSYLLFLAVLKLTTNFLDLAGASVVALAVCAASTLQHGIPWHNNVGLLFLIPVCMAAFRAVRAGTFGPGDTLVISIFLFLTGLTKLTYLMAALAIVGFCLLNVYGLKQLQWRPIVLKSAFFALVGIALPILLEVAVNGTSVTDWIWNVVTNPGRRSGRLLLILSKDFFLGTVQPFYFRNPFRAVFGLTLLLFLYLGAKFRAGNPNESPEAGRMILAARTTLILFFGLAAVLSVTNVDMASIAQTLLIIGLLCVGIGYGDRLSEPDRVWLGRAVLTFAAAFLVAGLVAIHRETRLQYPYVKAAGSFTHKLEGLSYLNGLWMSDRGYARIEESKGVLANFGIRAGSDEVYWGPGLDMLWRVFQTKPHPGFPLWYHIGVTVREPASPEIIQRLDTSPIRLLIVDKVWAYNFPDGVTRHLNAHWKRGETGSLIYFYRN